MGKKSKTNLLLKSLSLIGFVAFISEINAQTTINFYYSGNIQSWIVPCGVTTAIISVGGAASGGEGASLSR